MGTAIMQNRFNLSNDNGFLRDFEYICREKVELTDYRARFYIQIKQNEEIYYAALNAKVAIDYNNILQSISLYDVSLEEKSPSQHLLIQKKINELIEFQGTAVSKGDQQIGNNFYTFLVCNIHNEVAECSRGLKSELDKKRSNKMYRPSSIGFVSEENIDAMQLYISVGLVEENINQHKGLINRLYSILRAVSCAMW